MLIENKANINIATANGYTRLHSPMMRKHYEIAALLIKNGADVHAATANNSTPLHFAELPKAEASRNLLSIKLI
ncbi:ankyrin repeat domain-containing protein [Rickettsiella endosymbiont of Rhagonycha lignosa]|uniref:ankyrin repeat domain-containing protein n=1 Tax=Rickettsiella endosymbiont of Rhagonycha lignosa TaxID=3077937 RepID=UPI00313EC31A